MRLVESIHELLGNGGAAQTSSQRKAAICLPLSSLTAVQWLCSTAELTHPAALLSGWTLPTSQLWEDVAYTPCPPVLKIKDL